MAYIKNAQERDFRLVAASNNQPQKMDFNKIKVGKSTLQNDVTALIDSINDKRSFTRKVDRAMVERAIDNQNILEAREISKYFFFTSGIYSRLCRYMAFLYRYDYFLTPIVYDDKIKDEKVIEGWYKGCTLLDNSNLRKMFGKIALKVVRDGAYYGYKMEQKAAVYLQELPLRYCRSRYELNGKPAVEFNIKYFDDSFADAQYRLRVLKMFPKEFQQAYLAYKRGTLPKDFQGDVEGWFLLDPVKAVKFNLNDSDAPLFISVIPAIMDLDDAKDLDKQKMAQQILKIIIQQMPIDKNGDLIFDVEEAQALHNNVVGMVGGAIGLDVLTTFADVDVADLSDKGNVSSVDQLNKIERGVFNEAGTAQALFNTDGNIALDKSIANDSASMTDLILQFGEYAESLLAPFNKNAKRLQYRVQMLPTTIYNYQELSKLYKDQTMLGFSKLLPQVALGHMQSTILATAYFENKLMKLDELFTPPQMSSTMSGNKDKTEDKDAENEEQKDNKSNEKVPNQDEGGRPEIADDEKSDRSLRRKSVEG